MDFRVFVGPFVHSECRERVTAIDDGVLVVKDGKIVAAEALGGRDPELVAAGATVLHLQPGELLLPGFVDTHVHAPQFPNAGLGYDKPLLEWLQTYTFPLETKYRDQDLAARVYDHVVRQSLNAGTTLACYFATVHADSSLRLANSVLKAGQRALVGKVNMNMNAPPNLVETRLQSINDTKEFIGKMQTLENPLVRPVITPRFALSCDMELMRELGDLARDQDLHIQTHVSENLGEIEAVNMMYPQCTNYTDVYDKAGLLTKKTVLAHGVHLRDEELSVLVQRGTSIAHCPASNTCLRSGLCDVRRLLDAGVTVGLGSDISGGPSPCILDAMRSALDASIHLSFLKGPDYPPLNFHEVFFLATLGGAEALAMETTVGNFAVGKEFDAQLVCSPHLEVQMEPLNATQMLQKFIYSGSERDIKQVYVRGRPVKQVL